jgi:hypothetical protein
MKKLKNPATRPRWSIEEISKAIVIYFAGPRAAVNLVKTIKGFINLKRKLLQKVKYILPRAINQDCPENIFSIVRGHGRHNTLT